MFLGKGTDRYEQRSISNAAMAAGIMISLRSLVRELKRSTLAVPFIPNLEAIYRCEELCLFFVIMSGLNDFRRIFIYAVQHFFKIQENKLSG